MPSAYMGLHVNVSVAAQVHIHEVDVHLVVVVKISDSHPGHGDTSLNGLLAYGRPVNLHGLKAGVRLHTANSISHCRCFGQDYSRTCKLKLACRQMMAEMPASSTSLSMSAVLLGQEPTIISGMMSFQFRVQRLQERVESLSVCRGHSIHQTA